MADLPPATDPHCGACPIQRADQRRCINPDGKHPPDCPTALHQELAKEVLSRYQAPEVLPLAQHSARTERAGFRSLPGGMRAEHPRLVEIVDFAQRMGYAKLGLVFCFALRQEAATVNEILTTNGFTVASSICKVGNLPKQEIGLEPDDQLNPYGPETMCNPLMQAELMNRAEVDFAILLGLCVGHDTLVLQNIKAPVTILAVKDRTSAHNPLSCIYTYTTFSSYLKKPLFQERGKAPGTEPK